MPRARTQPMPSASAGRMLLLFIALTGWGCRGQTLRVYEENDVGGFGGGTDRYYTQGLRIEMTQPLSGQLPGLTPLARLLWIQPEAEDYVLQKQYLGFSAGQSIFTPEDISVETLQEDDRPYAGWLYGTLSWHNLALAHITRSDGERPPAVDEPGRPVEGARSEPPPSVFFTRNDRLDSLELQVGVVGPDSFADETQTRFHKIVGAQPPMGWDNQLGNEVGFELLYSRKMRNNHARFWLLNLEHDLITNFGGALGYVDTHFQVGGQVRVGHNLRRDFGLGSTIPDLSLGDLGEMITLPENQLEEFQKQFGERFSWYFFIGVDGRFVGRNIFLDGNTYKDSHSVEKERFVADFKTGIALQFKRLEVSYAQVARTPEFRGASDPQIFGSLQVAIRF